MVPSLAASCNSTLSIHTVGFLRSALATVDWIFCWNNSAQSANRVKVEGQGASEQFKEGGETHEPKSTTTTTLEVVVRRGADGIKDTVLLEKTLSVLVTLGIAVTLGCF